MSQADITLALPLPPSSNAIWRRHGAIMHKSNDYRRWLASARILCAEQCAGDRIPLGFEARIVLPVTRRDPDNSIKPTLDLLQSAGVIANDKFLQRLVLEVDASRQGTMLVELWSVAMAIKPKKARLRKAVPVQPLEAAA